MFVFLELVRYKTGQFSSSGTTVLQQSWWSRGHGRVLLVYSGYLEKLGYYGESRSVSISLDNMLIYRFCGNSIRHLISVKTCGYLGKLGFVYYLEVWRVTLGNLALHRHFHGRGHFSNYIVYDRTNLR